METAGRDLQRVATAGLFWVVVGQYGSQAVSFATPFILAALLQPYDYGVFGLAYLVVALFGLVKGLGFGPALVYEQEDVKAAADAAFWILLAIAMLLFLAAFLSAPVAAAFFDTPDLVPVIRVLGLSFVLFALRVVHEALLMKEFRFQAIARVAVVSVAGQSVVSVALAVLGMGAWSLLWGVMTSYALLVVMYWVVSPYRPSLHFDRKVARRLLRFGLFGLMSDVLVFLVRGAPAVAVGRLLGAAATGLYGFAFTLATVPESRVGFTINQVAHPLFAKLQGDLSEVKRTYLLIARYLALVVLPLAAGIFFLLPSLLLALYGEKWSDSIEPIRVLALFGLVMGMAAPNRVLLYGIGHPRVLFLADLAVAVLLLPAVYFVTGSTGITGVALLMTAANVVGALASTWWILSHLRIGIGEYLGRLWTPAVAVAVALGVLYVVRLGIGGEAAESVVGVFGLILAWGLVYCLALLALDAELRSFTLSALRHPRQTLVKVVFVVARAS